MPDFTPLSEREKEILQLVASGLTNREIAQNLGISPNTVKVHLSNIFEKTGVVSRTDASMFAVEHGIVKVPGIQTPTQGDQKNIIQFLLQFRWVWAALLLLIGTAFISLLFNVLIPYRSENPLTISDMTERWHEYSALPEARSGLTAVLYDGAIYAIGGQSTDGVSGKVFRYTTTEDLWESLCEKPTPVMNIEGVLIDERIFIAGGMTQTLSPTDVLEVYNPRNDTWEEGRSLPDRISNYAAIAYQGELFLFGGWNGTQVLDTVWIYNPETKMWRTGSAMKYGRMGADVVEVGGKLYLFGGTDGDQQVSAIEVFNPSRDASGEIAWATEGNLPDGVVILGVKELADFIFAVGKIDEETYMVMNYDVNNRTWHSLFKGTSHILFSDMGVCTLGEDIILLGGRNNQDEFQDEHWHFTAVYTISIPIISQ